MLGVVVAVIMAGTFFVPWLDVFGNQIGPMMLFSENAPPLGDLPWRVWAFLGSFVLAGLAVLLALMGRAAGLVMLVAGAIPFALVAEQALSARNQVQELGLPLPRGGDPAEAMDMIRQFVDIGLPAYVASAAALVVIGLVRVVRGA